MHKYINKIVDIKGDDSRRFHVASSLTYILKENHTLVY